MGPSAVLLFPLELSGWSPLCRARVQVLSRWVLPCPNTSQSLHPARKLLGTLCMPLQPKLQTVKKSPGHLRRAGSCQEESAQHGLEQTHSESNSKLNQSWPGHGQLGLLILGPGGRSPVPSLFVGSLQMLSRPPACSAVAPQGSYRPAQCCSEARLPKAVVLLTRNL